VNTSKSDHREPKSEVFELHSPESIGSSAASDVEFGSGGGGGGGSGLRTDLICTIFESLNEPESPPNFGSYFSNSQQGRSGKEADLEYLSLALQHAKAELSCFFLDSVKDWKQVGWRWKIGPPYIVDASRDADADCLDSKKHYTVSIRSAQYFFGGLHISNLAELKGHLVVWRENLFFTFEVRLSCGCKPNALLR